MVGVEAERLLLYMFKRVVSLLIIVFLIASAIFVVFFISGDPPQVIVPKTNDLSLKQSIISDLKLNESIAAQYLNFMAKTFSGKFFLSTGVWKYQQTGDMIYTPLTRTLELFGAVLVPGLLLGFVLGRIFSGDRELRLTSRLARLVSLGAASVPIMSAGLLLLYLLAQQKSIPLSRSILPPLMASLPIAVGSYILLMKGKERYFGTGTAEVRQPTPTSSITKLYVAWVMVVVLIAEMVFSYSGLGLLTWNSLLRRDATVLMASLFLIAVIIAFTNFLLDIVSPFVKSRFSGSRKGVETNPLQRTTGQAQPPVEEGSVSGGTMLVLVAKDYVRRRLGIAALVIVLVLLIIAVAAPFLATVPNPDTYTNHEPTIGFGSMNPRPPSLDRSPTTGFIHPLGTDIMGRDVYSELLYGARAPLVIAAILVALALVAGIVTWIAAAVASTLKGAPAVIVGGVSSVVADFIFAIPIFGVYGALWYTKGSQTAFLYSLLVVLPLLVFACSFRVVRVKMTSIRQLLSRRNPPAGRGKVCAILTGATGSILYVSKFVVMFGLISILAIKFFFPLQDDVLRTSWTWLSSSAYDWAAFVRGAWWLILPQLILTSLLAAALYEILDTLEQVWVRRFGTL